MRPDALQSTLSCYPFALCTELPEGEGHERGMVVVAGGTSDTAARCCGLGPSRFTSEALLPPLPSRVQQGRPLRPWIVRSSVPGPWPVTVGTS